MIINLSDKITLPNGTEIRLPDPKDPKSTIHATYGEMYSKGLATLTDNDKSLTHADKYVRGKLAIKVLKTGDVDLSIDELKLMKDTSAQVWGDCMLIVLLQDKLETGK